MKITEARLAGCVVFAFSLMSFVVNAQTTEFYKGLEFEMAKVKEPAFASNRVSIKEFGAIADGVTLNTKAFADAIEAVAKKGGGKW